jgi:hypothetical protein
LISLSRSRAANRCCACRHFEQLGVPCER